MSESATITLVHMNGMSVPKEKILEEIEATKKWDNGPAKGRDYYPVQVIVKDEAIMDTLESIEHAVKYGLEEYIVKKFTIDKSKVFKWERQYELTNFRGSYPSSERGHYRKIRKVLTNVTPPKKKRK